MRLKILSCSVILMVFVFSSFIFADEEDAGVGPSEAASEITNDTTNASTDAAVQSSDNADDQKKVAEINKLLEVTGAKEMTTQIINNLIDSVKKTAPNASEEFWSTVKKELNVDDLLNLIIPVYTKYLTIDEIKEIVKFYESPIGKKLISVTPQIAQETMVIGQKWGVDLSKKIQEKLKESETTKE